jgi:hypothetical protein
METTDKRMETTDRLERVAVILTTTEYSPSTELHNMGLRLLARELLDLEQSTRRAELAELAEVVGPRGARQCPANRVCDESAARVRRIMGRE